MRVSTSTATLTLALVASIIVAACGGSDATGPTATVSGVVSAATGAVIAGASVTIGSATATTGADGRFELQNVPVGSAWMTTTAPGFAPRSESVGLVAGTNTRNVALTPAGEWGTRAGLLEANSEYALAEANG